MYITVIMQFLAPALGDFHFRLLIHVISSIYHMMTSYIKGSRTAGNKVTTWQ